MKMLHTADWHLGQKFLFNDRKEEHALALEWLAETIKKEKIELLIVAGDVFDIQNPPNYARSLYYQFLTNLLRTSCRHVLIVGGNHDSPAMLNAPKELLRALNVHVVGKVSENFEDDIISLKNKKGELECVIAAVPFLRNQDVLRSVSGESSQDRIDRIKEGIYHYYEKMGKAVKSFAKENIPIIATGHLFAKGAETADIKSQSNIYIQNRENISAEQFPKVFDYVALGHIHRAQALGKSEHVRYSGSIIPLRFKETIDKKSVTVITFDGKKIAALKEVPVPEFRRLKTIEGNLDKVKKSLERFAAKEDRLLTPWVEIIVETEKIIPNLDAEIRAFAKDMNLDIIKVRTLKKHVALDKKEMEKTLEELDPFDVFQKKCESAGTLPDEMKALKNTFLELQDWMQEQED